MVDRVVADIRNLEAIDGLFERLGEGEQFGKLVVEIEGLRGSHQHNGKL